MSCWTKIDSKALQEEVELRSEDLLFEKIERKDMQIEKLYYKLLKKIEIGFAN